MSPTFDTESDEMRETISKCKAFLMQGDTHISDERPHFFTTRFANNLSPTEREIVTLQLGDLMHTEIDKSAYAEVDFAAIEKRLMTFCREIEDRMWGLREPIPEISLDEVLKNMPRALPHEPHRTYDWHDWRQWLAPRKKGRRRRR